MRPLTLLILLVTLASGCGGDSKDDSATGVSSDAAGRTTTDGTRDRPETSDEQDESTEEQAATLEAEARETVESFLEAIANGDSQGICDLLARAARAATERSGDCATVIERGNRESARDAARDGEVTAVELADDRATVTISAAGDEGTVVLTREGGEWKVLADM